MLDFTGGSLSIVQQVIDMVYHGVNGEGWSFFGDGDGFNIVKFLLGVIAWFFDIIFLIQHFILYPHGDNESVADLEQLKLGKPLRHTLLEEEDDDVDERSKSKEAKGVNSRDGKINLSNSGNGEKRLT